MAVTHPVATTRGRLTDQQRRDRALTELDFQRQLVGTKPPGLAVILGWEHVHFRPAMTRHGMRTPGSGSMALGWPDLVLVRARDRRLVFAELKRETGDLRPDQERVMFDVLWPLRDERIDVVVWRPSDLSSGEIERVLR